MVTDMVDDGFYKGFVGWIEAHSATVLSFHPLNRLGDLPLNLLLHGLATIVHYQHNQLAYQKSFVTYTSFNVIFTSESHTTFFNRSQQELPQNIIPNLQFVEASLSKFLPVRGYSSIAQ